MAYEPLTFSRQFPSDQIIDIRGFPAPPAQKIAPFHAAGAVLKLLANKEDTRQVFDIVGAMSGGSFLKFFDRFVSTDYGRHVVTAPIKLEEVLGRRDWLRTLPEGSVGRAYLAFMEGEDLTPDGILDAADEAGMGYKDETQFEELRRMSIHLDVAHDLWHVLTGYGRDTLGELCLLIFTHAQTGNFGLRMIIGMGAFASKLEQPGTPILKAMKEARHMGNSAAWFPAMDIEQLLPRQLDDVRQELNLITPETYDLIPEAAKARLLQPRVKETQTQREEAAA